MMIPFNSPPKFGGSLPALACGLPALAGNHIGDGMREISVFPAAPGFSALPSATVANSSGNQGGQKTKGNEDNSSPQANPIDLCMGIDFGTAFTKVVIRAPHMPEGDKKAYAVDFGKRADAPNDSSCLLPTAMWVGENGACSLAKLSGGKRHSRLKVGVMDPREKSEENFALAAAYLALVIQKSRRFAGIRMPRWFGLSEATAKLIWDYNVGIPAETARGKIADDYTRIVNAALVLSESRKKITLKAAERMLDRIGGDASVSLVPEVIAQAYGYVRMSGETGEGIHILADVGAWTLDICSFVSHQILDDRLDLQVASVNPKGCLHLHQARLNAIWREVSLGVGSVMPDQFRALPPQEEYWRRVAEKLTGVAGAVRRADVEFCDDCARIVKSVITSAVRQMRKMVEEKGTLPVIICGGGSEIPLYRNAIQRGWGEARKALWQEGFREPGFEIRPMPPPLLTGRGIDDRNSHRFSVAWGLSYPRISRKLWMIPPNSPPLQRPVFDPRSIYVGPEQV